MTPTETATILRQFNERCRDCQFDDPHRVMEAIDAAIKMIERMGKIEPQPCFPARDHNWYYAQGWNDCLKEVMEESK